MQPPISAYLSVSLAALSALLIAGCPTATDLELPLTNSDDGPTFVLGATTVEVPMETASGRPLVDVWLDGSGPYTFLVDTGASTTVVTPEVAYDLPDGLEASDRTVGDIDGTVIRVEQVLHVAQLGLGPAVIEDVVADVLDLSLVSAASGTTIDGILGFNLFSDVTVTIDYDSERISISQEPLATLTGKSTGLSFLALDDRPYIPITLGGEVRLALVDTGNTVTLQVPADLEGLSFTTEPQAWFSGYDLSGATEASVARLDETIILGNTGIANPLVIVGAVDEVIVGAGLLEKFTVSFDSRSALMQLDVRSGVSLTDGALRTFGLRYAGQGPTLVTAVLAGGPAEAAGVQVGDEIVAVNNTRLDSAAAVGLWFEEFIYSVYLNPQQDDVTLDLAGADGVDFSVTLESVEWVP